MSSQLSVFNTWVLTVGALAATVLLTPFVIRLARKLGAIDRGGYRKINGRCIPRMGGLAVALPFLLLCFLGIFHPSRIFGQNLEQDKMLLILLVGGVLIVVLGMYDDVHGLSAKAKFPFQIGVALLVFLATKGITSIELPLLGTVKFSLVSGALLTMLWIVGMVNAFNLIDGLDGLASGIALIGALGLGIIAAINGQGIVCILCLAFAGSLAGFLMFNFHPARCFLGDTGSLFIGFVMAMLALMTSPKSAGSLMLAPVLVLGFPIFDTLTSMARRILRGRNPFSGDRAHTHHRLLDYGYTQRQATLILYGVAFICALSAIVLQVYYPYAIMPLLVLGVYGLVFGVMAWVNGFLRPRHILRVVNCRERNNRLASFSRYASLALKNGYSVLTLNDVLRLGCRTLNLRFLEIAAEGYPGLAMGYYGEDRTSRLEESEPCEAVRVVTAEGRFLGIRFLPNLVSDPQSVLDEDAAEVLKLERQDITACLACVFHGVRMELLMNESAAEDTKQHNVQDLIEIVSPGVDAMAAPVFTFD